MTTRPSPLETVIHLGMFVSAGATVVLAALVLLERLSDEGGRTFRWTHVVSAAALFFALSVAERIYHAVE